MITLDRIQLAIDSDESTACIVLSSEEKQVAKKYKDLFFIERKLLEAALYEQSFDIERLNDLLFRAIEVVEFEKAMLQHQWKNLQADDKQAN